MRSAGLLLLAVIVGSVVPAEASESQRTGIALFAGYNSYAMDDINDGLAGQSGAFPGATVTADDITSGATFGGGLRLRRSEHVLVSIDALRMLAKTSGNATYLGQPFEGELAVPATAFTLTVNYFIRSSSSLSAGIGVGGGYYVCTGKGTLTGGVGSADIDLDGSGFGFHGQGLADVALTHEVHVEVGAGYRWAKTTDLDAEGSVLHDTDGSETQVDWSGFMGRLGLTFYVGGKNGDK